MLHEISFITHYIVTFDYLFAFRVIFHADLGPNCLQSLSADHKYSFLTFTVLGTKTPSIIVKIIMKKE